MNTKLQVKIPVAAEQNELVQKMFAQTENRDVRAVSFKLFDILLNLPFSEKHDLFLILQNEFPKASTARKSFSDMRIEAEVEARKKNTSKCAPTVEEIYGVIQKKFKLGEELCRSLMDRECVLIQKTAFPRSLGKMLFEHARELKHKTIVVADTVYPRSVVVSILGSCGYEVCDELIVSNEVDCEKSANESLFSQIVRKSGFHEKNLLHIGGNVEADVELPLTKGAKALLAADPVLSMIKSGRVRGGIQAAHIYDYDSADFLALHLAFGLYAAYLFDIPRSRQIHSDFCNNPYMLGFFVGGCCRIGRNAKLGRLPQTILAAMEDTEQVRRGMDDSEELFRRHFGDILNDMSFKGLTLPLEFFAEHAADLDRRMLKKAMDSDAMTKWSNSITDADVAPVHRQKAEQNSMEKLADKMFPPGTKVRNIADGMLVKLKSKTRLK